ncbi:Type II secretion system F family protein [Planctomycetales bacterium 10988]|nr:Type II secretion system F family protein [Planctomycetales bacterium 10988]
MAHFQFQARDRNGSLQQGTIIQPSLQAAIGTLRARNWLVLEIQALDETRELSKGHGLGWWIPARAIDVEITLRQMSVMLKSGMPLLDATRTLYEQAERRQLSMIWRDISEEILGGDSLADAMEEHPIFPPVVIYLTRVGEQTGELDSTLRRASDIVRQSRLLRSKILSAMAYPFVVFLAAVGISLFMVFNVIPKIQNFLQALGRDLPPMTQTLVDVTTFLNTNVYALGGGTALFLVLAIALWYWEPSRYWIDRIFLKVPVLGKVFRVAAAASFSRNLETLLQSGVSLLDGLHSIEKLVSNRRLSEQLTNSRELVVEGSSLADAIRQHADFTAMLPRIIAIGESSGRLDEVMGEAADYYEELLQVSINRLAALVEPLMLLIVGGIVGYVYISFFMALFAAAG